ncbi:serine/threonine-protein kinase [Kribbella sp. NPDC050241]|uniref:serine/threonine-protein kinase n=1 Tax=Kribbella sp. NPDC050241 TaxID=3364115 RepID=UPI0037933AC0
MEITLSSSTWTLGEPLVSDASGFGKVYIVRDGQGREAVAKFVPKDPGAERELLMGDSLSAAQARNVVPVLDSGEHEDQWVIVMPKADMSLAQHLAQVGRGALHPAEALEVLTDVATALADLAADGLAIVHRDLKPQNILRLDGCWCLCDFGIARYAEATTAADTRKYAMTKPYAAPEQWRLERATSATDVYAFGVIGYQLLSGQLPFPGPDFRTQHLHEHAPALAAGTARLRTLIEECLWKAPTARPTPAGLVARLAATGAEPSSPGAARLAQANQAEVERLSAEHAAAVAKVERQAARHQPFEVAAQSIGAIVEPLIEAIALNAPLATIERGGVRGTTGFVATLRGARIVMSNPKPADWDGPFTAISSAAITVTMSKPSSSGYEGRSHSLWFCDAQEADRFAWYETAFMDVLVQRARSAVPYALEPREAAGAVGPGMATEQVAWPFEELDRADPTEFVDRWINWFALAADRQLGHPSHMPEKPTGGSWRK